MKNLNYLFSTVKNASPVLYWIVIAHFIAALACVMGLFIDERTLMGVNVWVKPLKFCISDAIFVMTFGFLTTLYPFSQRKKNILNGIICWSFLIETAIIVLQGARGVNSHYNLSTAFDALLFSGMGLLVTINVVIIILYLVESIRLKLDTSKAVQWAIVLGWIIVVVGSWVGGQMISQMSHNVGVADGGAGIPILNWSTKGGDLRIAHFFGLHGIQIIPLFALWVGNKFQPSTRNQILVVIGFAMAYSGWIGYVFYQAKQGMPFVGV